MYIFGHHFYCLCVFSTRMMASLCVFSHVTLWPQKQQASGSHQLTNRPFVSCTFYMHLHPSAVVLQCDQEPSVLFTFYRSALFQSRSTSLSGHTIGQQKPHGQNIWNVGSLIYFTHSFISIPTNAADFFFLCYFFFLTQIPAEFIWF